MLDFRKNTKKRNPPTSFIQKKKKPFPRSYPHEIKLKKPYIPPSHSNFYHAFHLVTSRRLYSLKSQIPYPQTTDLLYSRCNANIMRKGGLRMVFTTNSNSILNYTLCIISIENFFFMYFCCRIFFFSQLAAWLIQCESTLI